MALSPRHSPRCERGCRPVDWAQRVGSGIFWCHLSRTNRPVPKCPLASPSKRDLWRLFLQGKFSQTYQTLFTEWQISERAGALAVMQRVTPPHGGMSPSTRPWVGSSPSAGVSRWQMFATSRGSPGVSFISSSTLLLVTQTIRPVLPWETSKDASNPSFPWQTVNYVAMVVCLLQVFHSLG